MEQTVTIYGGPARAVKIERSRWQIDPRCGVRGQDRAVRLGPCAGLTGRLSATQQQDILLPGNNLERRACTELLGLGRDKRRPSVSRRPLPDLCRAILAWGDVRLDQRRNDAVTVGAGVSQEPWRRTSRQRLPATAAELL